MIGRKQKYKVGDIFTTNRCGDVEIIDTPKGSYTVRFINTGHIAYEVSSHRLNNGKIHDHSTPLLHSAFKHGLSGIILQEYEGIVHRCNFDSMNDNRKKRHTNYEGCYLHKDFDTIYKFAEWRKEQPFADRFDYLGNKYHIEKDILVPGNLCYGPHTCTYVPQQINSFYCFIMGEPKDFPGTSFIKKSGKYMASMNAWPNRDAHKYPFNTREEAFVAYCEMKEGQAKFLAEHFEGLVDNRIIIALDNFKVTEHIMAAKEKRKIILARRESNSKLEILIG